jgi:hypothetical protein
MPTPALPPTTATPRANRDPTPRRLLQILAERFPAVFCTTPVKPLGKGIHSQLVAAIGHEFSSDAIQKALDTYVRWDTYLQALARGGATYNLDGEVVGEVSERTSRRARAYPPERHRELAFVHAVRQGTPWDDSMRARLLQVLAANGMAPSEFARVHQLPVHDIVREHAAALHARTGDVDREMVREFEASDLIPSRFARSKGISQRQLRRWMKVVEEERAASAAGQQPQMSRSAS